MITEDHDWFATVRPALERACFFIGVAAHYQDIDGVDECFVTVVFRIVFRGGPSQSSAPSCLAMNPSRLAAMYTDVFIVFQRHRVS